jgi:hypothetical protein
MPPATAWPLELQLFYAEDEVGEMADNHECSTDDLSAKPGWQTSEFYVTSFTACMPIVTAIFHRDFTGQIQALATVAAGVATASYSVARSHSKAGATKAKATVRAACVVNHAISEAQATPAPSSTPATAAVPIDTLATILAKLDELASTKALARS